jgi:hypothetical protein
MNDLDIAVASADEILVWLSDLPPEHFPGAIAHAVKIRPDVVARIRSVWGSGMHSTRHEGVAMALKSIGVKVYNIDNRWGIGDQDEQT